ncbi:MAG: hypothetical protein AAGI08_03980 [Bacteroidota bacterium]
MPQNEPDGEKRDEGLTKTSGFARRMAALLVGVFVVYAGLVAPHEGEFWPFSIYPMFSKAGGSWAKVAVREVDASSWPNSYSSESYTVDQLPGVPVALAPAGIDYNDVANFVAKTDAWTPERQADLRRLLAPVIETDRRLLVLRVRGAFDEDRRVEVAAEPVVLVTATETQVLP